MTGTTVNEDISSDRGTGYVCVRDFESGNKDQFSTRREPDVVLSLYGFGKRKVYAAPLVEEVVVLPWVVGTVLSPPRAVGGP